MAVTLSASDFEQSSSMQHPVESDSLLPADFLIEHDSAASSKMRVPEPAAADATRATTRQEVFIGQRDEKETVAFGVACCHVAPRMLA